MSSIPQSPDAALPTKPEAGLKVAPTPPPVSTPADGAVSASRIVTVSYWLVHLACFAVFFTGVSQRDLLLLGGSLALRTFAITAGYHRYFAHKSYSTSRPFQFVLAFLGATATQKGPLWWAGLHRRHHAYADRPGDIHSPKDGFWYSHQGWIFDPRWVATPEDQIRDFARFPELVWLNRYHVVPPVLFALACFAIGGLSGVVWGYVVATTVLWHTTYSVNSLAHRWGSRRYETSDTSRNNLWIALATFGEGWHNNHHHYMRSARQGFFWWEIDISYYLLRGLAAVGLVWDLREPPASVRDAESRRALREAA
jgi:stearoyl-CoA desaturase (delta-9 desaturase)